MTQSHCPKCSAILPSADVTAGRCGACGSDLSDAARTLDSEGDVGRTIEATARPAKSPGATAHSADASKGRAAKSTTGSSAGSSATGSGGVGGPGQKPSLVGQEIGGCRVIELVGTGAMGAVYAATQIQLDRKVAVKIIHPELWQNERVLQRFQQEARAVGKLSSPHVVQIHQVGFENGINYLVMEFVAGGNLRTYAARQPKSRITSGEAVKFMRQCVLGLKEAEANGILHRDIKPDNLLLDRNGDVKIADFGLAKTLGDRLDLTASSDLMGTPLYMSPEQCRGDGLDFRTDMYSLGATFYYLLTAQPPVEGKTIFEVLQTKTKLQCLSPAAALPELSGAGPVSRVIERMTALNAADRYPTYDALLADIDKVEKGEKVSGVKRRAPEREASKAPAAIAGVVFLALAGAGVWFVDPFGWREAVVVDSGETDAQRVAREAEAKRKKEEADAEARRVAEADAALKRTEREQEAERERQRRLMAAGLHRDAWQAEYDKMRNDLRAEGPTDGVRTLARRLLSEMPEESDSTLQQQVRKLIDDIAAGYEITQSLRDVVPPKTIVLPLTDVEQHVERVRAVLGSAKDPGPELAVWLETWRTDLIEKDGLRDRSRQVLSTHWSKVKETDLRAVTTDLQQRDFERDLNLTAESKARLCQVFPDLTLDLDKEIDAEAIAASRAELELRRTELALLADLRAAQATADGVDSLAAWASKSRGVSSALSALRTRRDELVAKSRQGGREIVGEPMRGVITAAATEGLDKAVGALKERADFWTRLQAGLELGISALGRGELTAANEHLARLEVGSAEVPELGRFRAALDALALGVDALRTRGEVSAADIALQRARDEVVKLGPDAKSASVYLDTWRQRLVALRAVTAEMVPVAPDKVELSDGTEVAVPAFFIDRYEVTRADYRRFLREVQKDGSPAAAVFTARAGRDRALALLDDLGEGGERDRQPMDNLAYDDALAYVRWQKKALPRLSEWLLAAKGPVGKATTFPWGDRWSSKPGDRNATQSLVNVDAGGRAARFQEPSVHHLAGNVAEWLEADPTKTRGQLVGGHFRDEVQAVYSGKQAIYLPLGERAEGSGCRGVLRVLDFVADLLPK